MTNILSSIIMTLLGHLRRV